MPLGNPSGFHALINGCVTTFQKGYGPFFLENRIAETNVYLEDNWKLASNLTLNVGIRYEYVEVPKEANQLIGYGYVDDKNNIEPRVGFAYSPQFEKGLFGRLFGGAGNSSIRAGYGLYHGRLFQSVFSQSGATVRFNPPNALFYNQTGVTTTTFTPTNLADPTNGFVFVPGPQTARHTLTIVDPNLEVPYTQQWNLTFERKLPWATALKASYTGNRGIGLVKFGLDNLPSHDPVNGVFVLDHPNNAAAQRGQVIRLAADAFCAGTTATTLTTACPVVVPIGNLEYSRVVPRNNERRPDPRYGTNIIVNNGAWSYYHAMQLELIKKLSNGFNFSAAYTWSKSLDTNSEATAVGTGDSNQNGNDSRVSRGFSRFHTPHRFTFFGTYRLPFFAKDKGIMGQILGGWQMSTVMKLIHGTPFTVSGTAFDLNFDGFSETRPVLLNPSILGNSISNPNTSQQLLPLSAFASPTSIGQFNCCILGRNTFFLDGVKNIDVAFSKTFPMPWGERHNLLVRADMFNAFNHVQYGFPNVNYTATTLGVISTTATSYAARNIQVSLKYNF